MKTLLDFLTSIKSGTARDNVLFVQKGVTNYVCSLLGDKANFGRRGFLEMNGNIFFQVKTPQDITIGRALFSGDKQFLITGSDVLKKGEISGIFEDSIIEKIPSRKVWESDSTLSVFGQMNSLQEMTQKDTPPDIIYTRGAPILTQSAIDIAYPNQEIEIREVDGNTEAYVAIGARRYPSKIICGTEFVQTGTSLRETGSYILREDGIYEPTRGETGDFSLLEQNQSAPRAKSFAEKLTLEVNVLFAQIITK